MVTKFRNQKPPENATREQVEQWEKNKLTPKKVLAVIRRYITSQNTVPRKVALFVSVNLLLLLMGGLYLWATPANMLVAGAEQDVS